MVEFISPLYNLSQHFTNHCLRLDTLDSCSWLHAGWRGGGVTAVTMLYTAQIVFRCFAGTHRFHLPSSLFSIDFTNFHPSIIRSVSIDSARWYKDRTANNFQLLPSWPLLLLLATIIYTCHMQRILDAEKSTVLRGHCFRWEVNYICCYTRSHRPAQLN
jgi:hypothetical protein